MTGPMRCMPLILRMSAFGPCGPLILLLVCLSLHALLLWEEIACKAPDGRDSCMQWQQTANLARQDALSRMCSLRLTQPRTTRRWQLRLRALRGLPVG